MITSDDVYRRFRSDTFDNVGIGDDGQPDDSDCLWQDVDIYEYLEDALEQVAADTQSLFRRVSMSFEAGAAEVKLTSRALDVRRVVLDADRDLTEFNLEDPDVVDDYGAAIYHRPNWETATGVPRRYSLNYRQGFVRLYPIPVKEGVLSIFASWLPEKIHPGMILPFQERKDFHLILLWMKKLAYAKQDADTLDLERSQAFENEYEERVVRRESEQRRRRRRPGTVRMNT